MLVSVFAISAGVAGAAGVGFLIAGLVSAPSDDPKDTKPAPVSFNVSGGPSGMFMTVSGAFQ